MPNNSRVLPTHIKKRMPDKLDSPKAGVTFKANAFKIPVIGLGVYQTPPNKTKQTVLTALQLGYRHIDTAKLYGNEAECGAAIKQFCEESGTGRHEIFYTTKLWNTDTNLGYDGAVKAIDKSLEKSGLEYIDLYLVHSPLSTSENRAGAWRAMEEAVEAGKIRSLGISNYGINHLKQLLDSNPKVKPAVGQYEIHPWLARKDIVDFARKNGIVVEAYSPLAKARRMDDPLLKPLTEKHSKSPAQILIRWSIQKGFVVLPKTVSEDRLKENIDVFDFELDEDDMKSLDTDEYYVTAWDPTIEPLEAVRAGD